MTNPERISDEQAKRFKLWFFRDLSDDQRLALFRLTMHEVPADQLRTHAAQTAALEYSLARRSPPAQEGMVLVPREPTEAVNIADAILRQVRRTLAAEDRHYTSSDPLHTRDEADLEYSRLVGFSLAQCDAALAVVRRRRAMIDAALAPVSDAVKPGDET